MKKIFLVIGLAVFLTARAYAYDSGDFQVWNTDVEELKVNHKTKIALEEEFRWGDNASEFFYQHYDFGLFYDLNKYLNIGGGYRQIYELKSGNFKPEEAPYLTATLFGDWKGFKFDDRSRLEYRHFSYQADGWRYRNKFTLKFPWKFTKLGLQPYLSDEMLIVFGVINQFNENRFSSGLSVNLTKNIKAELYYMLRTVKGTDTWIDGNVLGAKLKVAF
ncbi:MAG: DUF2490 domain-containing protein [Candidatus Omnitrophota bacterium]|nr:DUF2490 domain-containing protein [Candidatus Omnitrophota bacterium]